MLLVCCIQPCVQPGLLCCVLARLCASWPSPSLPDRVHRPRTPPLPQASRPADAAEQTRLQTQAFEAINEVVRHSAADTTPMVVQLIPLVVSKLMETVQMNTAGSAEAEERQSEIQVGGCGEALSRRPRQHVLAGSLPAPRTRPSIPGPSWDILLHCL